MYSPSLCKLLIESHSRDLNRLVALRLARQPLTAPRPRRWRLRPARPQPAARFAT
jgi:hypothetical protein